MLSLQVQGPEFKPEPMLKPAMVILAYNSSLEVAETDNNCVFLASQPGLCGEFQTMERYFLKTTQTVKTTIITTVQCPSPRVVVDTTTLLWTSRFTYLTFSPMVAYFLTFT